MADDEEFPHSGEHLDNDARIARATVIFLGIFAVLSSIGLIAMLRAMGH
jgi:hypothetical protein